MIKVNEHIAAMAPYALARPIAGSEKPVTSLAQNECFRPPSPRVREAVEKCVTQSMLYPDPDWTVLRSELSKVHRISESDILCGNGSLELINALTRTFSGPTGSVLAPENAYPFFRTAAQMVGARFDVAPELNGTVSVANLLSAVQADTRIVFVANPGNPTGTRISKAEIETLRSSLAENIILVIDEAYGEFSDHIGERCFDMVETGNVVVLRTFSKAYGLAGMRVGWGLFPNAIATEVRKVLNPNNVSAASQHGAIAALSDQAYMQNTCAITIDLREQARSSLIAGGLEIPTSYTNFLLIKFQDYQQARSADDFLRDQGIMLRAQAGAGLPQALRMTIGTDETTALAASALLNWTQENSK